MMSRSRTVSRMRRAEPASDTSTDAGCSAAPATTARSLGSVVPSSARLRPLRRLRLGRAPRRSSARCRRRCPRGPRSCPPSAAAFSASTVVMPSSCQIRRAVFGPSPGRRMNVATSAGTSALRFVSAWISPSSTTSTIFPSIVLPIPCSAFALPSSASCATDAGVSRIRAAARLYALMRKIGPRAPSGRRAARAARRAGRSAAVSATSAIIGAPCARPFACHLRRASESRADAARPATFCATATACS